MARLGRDTNFWSQPPKGQPMSQHQKSCRDTELPVPCRDTKKCVATQPQLPCSFCVLMPKVGSRRPNGCPCRDIKNHVSTNNQPVLAQQCRDTKIYVATWGQGFMSRARSAITSTFRHYRARACSAASLACAP